MKILCNGMPRAASTWMYNVVRLLACEKFGAKNVAAGWYPQTIKHCSSEHIVVKHHGHHPEIHSLFDYFFYSYRDIRDVLASRYKKFRIKPSIEEAEKLMTNHIDNYNYCLKSDHCYSMKYEEMILSPPLQISKISLFLFDAVICDPQEINEKVTHDLFHKKNLFSQSHRTSNGQPGQYKKVLDPKLIKQLNEKYFNE